MMSDTRQAKHHSFCPANPIWRDLSSNGHSHRRSCSSSERIVWAMSTARKLVIRNINDGITPKGKDENYDIHNAAEGCNKFGNASPERCSN